MSERWAHFAMRESDPNYQTSRVKWEPWLKFSELSDFEEEDGGEGGARGGRRDDSYVYGDIHGYDDDIAEEDDQSDRRYDFVDRFLEGTGASNFEENQGDDYSNDEGDVWDEDFSSEFWNDKDEVRKLAFDYLGVEPDLSKPGELVKIASALNSLHERGRNIFERILYGEKGKQDKKRKTLEELKIFAGEIVREAQEKGYIGKGISQRGNGSGARVER